MSRETRRFSWLWCIVMLAAAIGTSGPTARAQTVSAGGGTLTVGAMLQEGPNSAILSTGAHGGITVRLTSSNPAVALVATSATTAGAAFIDVPVANGSTSFSYYIQGVAGTTGTATITASAPGFTGTNPKTTNVVQPGIRIDGVPASTTLFSPETAFLVRLGIPGAGNVGLTTSQSLRPGATLAVTISSSNGSVGLIRSSTGLSSSEPTSVAGNSATSPSAVSGGGVALVPAGVGTTTITAAAVGFAPVNTVTATVVTPGITTSASNAAIGAGLQEVGYNAFLGGSNHGGVTVRIASDDPSRLLVSPNGTTMGSAFIDVAVANGSSNAAFALQGVEGTTGTTGVTITAPGFTGASATVNVVQPALRLESVPSATTTLSANTAVTVRLGVPAAGNASLASVQSVRAGAPGPVVATLTNSNAIAAQLVNNAGPGQVRTANIAIGSSTTPSGAAAGGLEFDPIAAGTTTVTASIPGFITVGTAPVVTISAPAITHGLAGATVGAGLVDGSYSVFLGAGNHGGVTLRVTSLDPSRLLLATNSTTAGTAFIDLPLANGSTTASLYIQGVEGMTGSVGVSMTAPGFTNGSATVNVVQPAVRLDGVPAMSTSLSANLAMTVRVGTPVAGNTGLASVQAVRVGGPGPLTVTISNSNASAAQLTSSAGSGQVRTTTVAVGSSVSPGALAQGGVEFDPLASGTTVVSASIPGFVPVSSAAGSTCTITGPGIASGLAAVTLGAGLQDGSFNATLGASNHGGVTVRITSQDPSRLLISPNATTAGAAFIDVPVANGNTSASYFVHAIEGVTGSVGVTCAAPGFSPGAGSVTIVQPALRLDNLATLYDPPSQADIAFSVRSGVPNVNGTALNAVQAARAGGTGILITASNTNAAAAQLVNGAGVGQTRTMLIVPGSNLSPTTVAGGGIAFDLLNVGTTTVSVAAAGFAATPSASVTVVIRCRADFNDNGQLTVEDIFSFLNAYFSGNLTADFNSSGSITVEDIFSFLGAYFAGCIG